MAQVGEFPTDRRMIRSLPNPIDKSTIVSIMPIIIRETKNTLQPSEFEILPGSMENPSLLVVGPAVWWKDFGEDQPLNEMLVPSVQLAESIIKDYCNSMLKCDMDSAIPGLFFVPGEVSLIEIRMKYKLKLEEVNAKQINWFKSLVHEGDSLWARSNGNPLVIWDMMRLACKALHEDRPWLQNFQSIQKSPCFACGTLKDPKFPVCPNCKIVDPNHPMAGELKLVSVG